MKKVSVKSLNSRCLYPLILPSLWKRDQVSVDNLGDRNAPATTEALDCYS